MINLEFIGCLQDDATVLRDKEDKPCGITFRVSVARFDNSTPKHRRVTYTHVHCTKSGCCSADARFVRGQKVYIRGDIRAGKDNTLECKVWQFELM